jgi:hypothetical protein
VFGRRLDPLGEQIYRAVQTDAAYAVIPEWTWQEGGCHVLAEALRRRLEGAHLVGVVDVRGSVQHFCVERAGRFYDSDGDHSREEMLAKLNQVPGVRVDRLVRFPATHREPDIVCDEDRVVRLLRVLPERIRTVERGRAARGR